VHLLLLFVGDVVSSKAFVVAVADDDGVGDAFLPAVSCVSGCFVLLFGTPADVGDYALAAAAFAIIICAAIAFSCCGHYVCEQNSLVVSENVARLPLKAKRWPYSFLARSMCGSMSTSQR